MNVCGIKTVGKEFQKIPLLPTELYPFDRWIKCKKAGVLIGRLYHIFSAIVHFNLVYKYNVATLNGEEMKEEKRKKEVKGLGGV